MKKIIIIFAIAILLSPILFAETHVDTREVVVNTTVPVSATLILAPLSQAADSGMPFDVTGSDVAWNQSTYSSGTGGRHIADWTIEANMSSLTLSITATPLINSTDGSALNYYLLMDYSYYPNGIPSSTTLSGVIPIHSNATTTYSLTNGPVYFSNKSIRFMFDSSAASGISAAPDGGYNATLTITLTEGAN